MPTATRSWRAHQEWLRLGGAERAARCAFWLAFGLLNRGELARAGGWLARARRLLDDGHLDCVEQGYLLLPVALQRGNPLASPHRPLAPDQSRALLIIGAVVE